MVRLRTLILYASIGFIINIFRGIQSNAQQLNIYVSVKGNDRTSGTIDQPVRTLYRAQQLIRANRIQHSSMPVTVYLHGGTYYLDSTLVFNSDYYSKDDAPVVFKNYHREKVIISGGCRLYLHWKRGKNGIYNARVPGSLSFDQLFVNGDEQVRARYPNDDSSAVLFNGVSKMALSPARIKSWHHPAGGFIHALQKYHWGSLSYRITGKSNDSSLIVEGGYQINRSHAIDSNIVFVENIQEELDTTHEWYYNSATHILYYMPPEDLNLQQAKIEVSVLTELIAFKGNTTCPVSHIHFDGITFTHSKETFMRTREPLLRGDWNIFRGGAILLNGTENCTFSNCNFESLGGNAVFLSNYNVHDTIRHCLIRTTGASGICVVGNPSAVRSPSFNYDYTVPYNQLDKTPGPKNNDFPQDCYIYDNLIYNIGQIEKQTAGVELSMCMNISVVHNTIYRVPRSGININDGCWGGDTIADNEVFETVLETGDNGAFNSWGRDRYWSSDRHYMDSLVAIHPALVKLDVIHPIIIRHNLFRCDHGWDIDLDDGSSNYIIDSNLCLNGGIKNREGFYRKVENNMMINNTFYPQLWFKNSHDIFMHNIVMRPLAPTQMLYWGDAIDDNLFPDSVSLMKARAGGTDKHSAFATPVFYNPSKGDFRVRMNNRIHSIGFHNFSMNDFGVVTDRLKTLARQPAYPMPSFNEKNNEEKALFQWEGAVFKNVQGLDEQSALGLPKAEGVYVMGLSANSLAFKKGLRENDVILAIGKEKIHSFNDFRQALIKYRGEKALKIKIYRDQKNKWLIFFSE